jgi:prophage regulatory protein
MLRHNEVPRLPNNADRFLSKKQVSELIGVSRATIDRMVKAGTFPHPQKISRRRVGWRYGTVQAWISSRPQRNS